MECGKEMYLSPRELQRRKYCSRECQGSASDKRRARTCPHCGKAFAASVSVGKYCSTACYQASRQKSPFCLVCQKPLGKQQIRYCSHECRGKGKITLEQKPCEQCGKVMRVEHHQLATKRFCSKACHSEAKRLSGPGSLVRRPDGYLAVYYPSHPDASRDGRVLQHRLVAEQKYGRRILPTEHVHHLNGVKDDNRPENLEVIQAAAHTRVTNREGMAKRRAARAELEEYRRRFGPLD